MSRKFSYWQECTDSEDMDALWSDPTVSNEWLNAGETREDKVHLSRDPYGQPYLTQTEMRAVTLIVTRRHFGSTMDQDMIYIISELESARQPFATNTIPSKKNMEISYGLMQLLPKTVEWIFRDLGYQDYEIEGDPSFLYKPFVNVYLGAAYLKWLSNYESNTRSEEFIVRAFKAGPKKATHKSTLPYWKRYLSVKESLPSRNDVGNAASTWTINGLTPDQAHHQGLGANPSRVQGSDDDKIWDYRVSPDDMQELWSRRGIYREWMNSNQKKGCVWFCQDEKKRPYLSQQELLAIAEIIFTKHFNGTKGFTPPVLCALAEVVSMRYVDGVGSKTSLMGIEYHISRQLHYEMGYNAYKVHSVIDLKNPFASMYFASAYLNWLSQYEDRTRSPTFVIKAYLSRPESANDEESMSPDYCKYKTELNIYEALRRDQDGCIVM